MKKTGFPTAEAAKIFLRGLVWEAAEYGLRCDGLVQSEDDSTWTVVEGDDLTEMPMLLGGCGTMHDPGWETDYDCFGYMSVAIRLREDLGLN